MKKVYVRDGFGNKFLIEEQYLQGKRISLEEVKDTPSIDVEELLRNGYKTIQQIRSEIEGSNDNLQ